MIIKNYQLTGERQIEVKFKQFKNLEDKQVLVRPKYLSICAADNRYYFAKRDKAVMNSRLPMTLIHEAIGQVVLNTSDSKLSIGDWVVMVPNHPTEKSSTISENYLKSSKFRSSSMDGFMQEYVQIDENELIKIPVCDDMRVYVLSELLSVVIHSLRKLDIPKHAMKIGVWGDGSLSFLTCLYLKKVYPHLHVTVIGKHSGKLEFFNFVDCIEHTNDELIMNFDIGIEAVGGVGAEFAIKQIINEINPEGKILLLGVSEYPININTRLVLEKGLTLQGASRSSCLDIKAAVDFISSDPSITNFLNILITDCDCIHDVCDIQRAFQNQANLYWGKGVMEWII